MANFHVEFDFNDDEEQQGALISEKESEVESLVKDVIESSGGFVLTNIKVTKKEN